MRKAFLSPVTVVADHYGIPSVLQSGDGANVALMLGCRKTEMEPRAALMADAINAWAGWLPMDTAPLEERVLLRRRNKQDRETFRAVVIGRRRETSDPKCWVFESVYARTSDFTGWMPLPGC